MIVIMDISNVVSGAKKMAANHSVFFFSNQSFASNANI